MDYKKEIFAIDQMLNNAKRFVAYSIRRICNSQVEHVMQHRMRERSYGHWSSDTGKLRGSKS